MMDSNKFLEDRISGLVGFIGLILVVTSDRIGIYLLYQTFGLKVHNIFAQWMLCFMSITAGIGFLTFALFSTIQEKSILFNTIGLTIVLGTAIFARWATVKSQYVFFPLDDNFYLDKNGTDIRDQKKER